MKPYKPKSCELKGGRSKAGDLNPGESKSGVWNHSESKSGELIPRRKRPLTLAAIGSLHRGRWNIFWILTVALSLGLVSVLPSPAFSARRKQVPIRALQFLGWRSSLEVDGSFSRTRFVWEGQTRNDTNRRTAPGLRLRTRGYVYHPRFLTFDVSGRILYSSALQAGNVRSYDEESKQTLDEYSIRTMLLETNPVSLEWVLDRSYSRLNVSRVADVITANNRQTYKLSWKDRTLPVDLSYDNLRRRTENAFGSDERQRSLTLAARLRNQRTTGEFRLDRTRLEDTKLGYDYVRYQGVATLNSVFDGWSTGLFARWWRQRLTEDLENIRLTGNTTHALGRGFEVRFGLEGERIERLGARRDEYVGLQLGAAHQLYESVTTTTYLRLRNEGPSTGSIRSLDAQLDTRYQKRVPQGRLTFNAGLRRIEQETEEGSITRQVVGRELRFDLADRIELTDPEINISTVEVTDSIGVRVYRSGFDYELEELGGGVLIRRIPGGDIPPDAPVRLSYAFRYEGAVLEGIETVDWGARIRTDPGLYGKVTMSKSYPTRPGESNSVGFSAADRSSVGAGWNRGLFGVDWERSQRDQKILPWERDQLRVRAGVLIATGLRLTGDASRGWSRFSDDGTETSYEEARASFSWSSSRRMTLRVEGSYRDEETLSGRVESWTLRPAAEFILGLGRIAIDWREQEIRSESTGDFMNRLVRVSFRRRLN